MNHGAPSSPSLCLQCSLCRETCRAVVDEVAVAAWRSRTRYNSRPQTPVHSLAPYLHNERVSMCLCSAAAVHIFATSTQSYHERCPSVMGNVSPYLRVGHYSDARLPVSNNNLRMELTEIYKSRFCMECVVGSIAQRSNI